MILTKGLNRIPVYRYHAETLAYQAAIQVDSAIGVRSLQHVDKFVRDCKEAGVWGKLLEVAPFAGNDFIGALVKLKFQTNPTMTGVNFVIGDYSEATGLQGDGATKYVNLNYDGALMPATAHVSAYVREDPISGVQYWMGSNDAGGTQFLLFGTQNPATNAVLLIGGSTSQATMGVACTRGFYYGERAANNDLKYYRNNALVASNATAITMALPSQNVFGFARNVGGTPASYVATRLSFLSIGQNLTAQERTDFFNAVQTLQTNLGRAV